MLADEYRVRRNTMKKAMHEALRSAVRALVVVVPPSDKRLNASGMCLVRSFRIFISNKLLFPLSPFLQINTPCSYHSQYTLS